MTSQLLLPDTREVASAPFWRGLGGRRLMLQQCRACEHVRFPPGPFCPQCLSEDAAWTELAGEGTVWSYAVYHRAFHPSLAADIPYTVALVELDGTRVLLPGRVDEPRGTVAVGDRATATFFDATPEVTLLRWSTRSPSADHVALPVVGGGHSS